jgi:acyl-CoA thioesterase
MLTPKKIVQHMMAKDDYSQWLGITITKITKGACIIKMQVRTEMLNGHGTAHGGITYSFADSALGFASNSHGFKCVSVETSISHTKPVNLGDVLIAEVTEESCSNKIGIYTVKVMTQKKKEVVALFKGTVYRTAQIWE